MALELIGKIDNFSDVFDFDEWAKVKDEYFWRVKLQKDPFSKEVQEKINIIKAFLVLPVLYGITT